MRHPIFLFGGGGREGRDLKKTFLGPMGLPSNSQNIPQDVHNSAQLSFQYIQNLIQSSLIIVQKFQNEQTFMQIKLAIPLVCHSLTLPFYGANTPIEWLKNLHGYYPF